jgi:hypothetical protein
MFRLVALLLLLLPLTPRAETLALIGATLVNTDDYGHSARDVADAAIVIRDGVVVAAGPRMHTSIPPGARRVDVHGKWIVPGLIDGFSAQLDRGQAYANLVMGVTTISQDGDDDSRRGPYVSAWPQPNMRRLDMIYGYDVSNLPSDSQDSVGFVRAHGRKLSATELAAQVAEMAKKGVAGVMLMYPLDEAQLAAVAAAARAQGLFTIGELGHARYASASLAGVNAFVHESRFVLDLTPPDLHVAIADDPFGDPAGPVTRRYLKFLSELDLASPAFHSFAGTLASHHTALMPTLAIETTMLEDTPNPWESPVGPLILPAHVPHLPFDRVTGQPALRAGATANYITFAQALAQKSVEAVHAFHAAGVPFLTGSGAVAFGVLPGWGEHRELALLVRAGLTPREAVAAATGNYAALYGWKDVGRIAPGFRADMVVLDADPTASIANVQSIHSVYLAGEKLDRRHLLAYRPGVLSPAH